MTSASHVPRLLLRRLRAIMAEREPAQQKLDRIVRLIAADMVAEVCSLYVLVGDDTLELFASEGLRPEAVHRVRLAVGEGLVGTIAATAEPLNLPQARRHPAFRYLPETGEDAYSSFLGVPILRGGLVSGVLVVQNRKPRQYTEEEREVLEVIAMVLAEFLASPEVQALREALGVARVRSHHLHGEGLLPGLAIGRAWLHEPRIVIRHFEAADARAEHDRLHEALGMLRAQLQRAANDPRLPEGDPRDVFEVLGMFASDRGWIARMEDYIRFGLTAEAAVARVQADNRARMLRQRDPYLRARLHDLDDLSWRLLRLLAGDAFLADAANDGDADAGKGGSGEQAAVSDPLAAVAEDADSCSGSEDRCILFARGMGPAELLDHDHRRIAGLVLEEGARQAHVTLVAKALGIPLVAGVAGATDLVENGDVVVVDGRRGEVLIRPDETLLDSVRQRLHMRANTRKRLHALRNAPNRSRDGVRIGLFINAGLPADLEHLQAFMVDGIGLFRTEMHFLMRRHLPGRQEQQALYASVLKAAAGRPVHFRTLDIGADKVPLFMTQQREPNPAMGWRAVRMGLDRPGLLKMQLRALLTAAAEQLPARTEAPGAGDDAAGGNGRAAAGEALNVMFPMIADIGELRAAKELLAGQVAALRRLGRPVPNAVRVGVMLEVPALLWQLPALRREADFISIGTNDLMQFIFAADRTNPRTAQRYDPLHPAMLRLLAQLQRQLCIADGRKVPVTVCGDMAANPLEAMMLLGLGFERLSMPPAGLEPVKAMLHSLPLRRLRRAVAEWLADDAPSCSLREQAARFARDNGVDVLGL